jgi:hypothetical protein
MKRAIELDHEEGINEYVDFREFFESIIEIALDDWQYY